jgi:hypothetical protein
MDLHHPDIAAAAEARELRPTYRTARALDADRACNMLHADDAMRAALDEAEEVARLLDRHDSDSGDDAAMIDCWAQRLRAMADEIRTALGEPRVMKHGVLVPARGAHVR